MEENEQNIIQTLRKRVEQDAQRKSQKIKADNANNQSTGIIDSKNQNQNRVINIFANLKKPEQNNLFGGQRKSVNLFQMQPKVNLFQNGAQRKTQNIFNIQQKPTVQNQQSNEQKSQDEQQFQIQQKSQNLFKTEPEVKIMKYQYKNQLTRILQMSIRKFKYDNELAREQIYLTLESLPNQPSTLYLIIRANTTKVIVYQGIMIKNISNMEHFMGKIDNLRFNVLKKKSNNTSENNIQESSQKKMKKQIVKIQFFNDLNSHQFRKTVNNYFEGNKTN